MEIYFNISSLIIFIIAGHQAFRLWSEYNDDHNDWGVWRPEDEIRLFSLWNPTKFDINYFYMAMVVSFFQEKYNRLNYCMSSDDFIHIADLIIENFIWHSFLMYVLSLLLKHWFEVYLKLYFFKKRIHSTDDPFEFTFRKIINILYFILVFMCQQYLFINYLWVV